MVNSSQMKKEAAEVRKMIAASRLAKKQAAAKERKQKSKKSTTTAAPAAALTEREKQKLRMRKGVMITSEDLRSGNQDASQSSSATTPNKKGGKKSTKAAAAAAVAATVAATVEPPYNYEIHHKNAIVTIRVTLHKVPPSTIDISQTNSKQFILQTPKFTKKFFLSFDFPGGLEIVPAKAEYTFDMGVLTCVLPIKNGVIPAEIAEERDAFLKKVTTQKAMRFRVNKEGELVVRTRQALLPKAEAAAASVKKAAPTSSAATPATVGEGAEEKPAVAASKGGKKVAKKEVAAPPTAAKSNNNNKKVLEAAKTAALKVAKTMTLTPEGKQAAVKAVKVPVPQGAPRKQFVDDGAAMLAMADAAGAAVKNRLYENLKKAKDMQAKKVTRMATRQDKTQVKKEKQEVSFMRVIAEQKKMLLQKINDQKPAEKKVAKSAPSKQVKFA